MNADMYPEGDQVLGSSNPDLRLAGGGSVADIPVTPQEDEAFGELTQKLLHGDEAVVPVPEVARFEEWHVTVEGSPIEWYEFCRSFGDGDFIKPLYIELSDGSLQLFCAMSLDPHEPIDSTGSMPSFVAQAEQAGFDVIRVKHEVSRLNEGETALYYEAHVKLDGKYRADRRGASRNLYRPIRWYITRRSYKPIDVNDLRRTVALQAKQSKIDSVESEIVLLDTNPGLDGHWGTTTYP